MNNSKQTSIDQVAYLRAKLEDQRQEFGHASNRVSFESADFELIHDLAETRNPAVKDLYFELLSNGYPDLHIREWLLSALAFHWTDHEPNAQLLTHLLLHDPSADVRLVCASALRAYAFETARFSLETTSCSDEEEDVRVAAFDSLLDLLHIDRPKCNVLTSKIADAFCSAHPSQLSEQALRSLLEQLIQLP